MKSTKLTIAPLAVMVLGACAGSLLAGQLPAKDRITVLISLDGFPAWMWRDPALAVPTLRRLAKEGVVAEAMTVSNPSVTWINHTTLITGVNPRKHGVLYNGLLVRPGPDKPPRIEPWRDKAELVRVPTLYDAAFKAGLTTAQVDWVAITNASTINWHFCEVPNPDSPIEREMAAAGLISRQDAAEFQKGKNIIWRDMMWTRAGAHIIRAHKPNLLLIHLLTTDTINHGFGPGTLPSFTAYSNADRLVAELLGALEEAGLKDRATVFITTDHGFKKVSQAIYPNVALRKAGLLTTAGPTVTKCDAYVVTSGGIAFAFVTDPAKRAQLLPKLKGICQGIEGVDRVLDGNEGPTLGMPTPAENQGMGDLILYPKAGFAFQSNAAGDAVVADSGTYRGSHGYLSSDPELDGIFIAWGHGIKPGAKLGRIANIDIAPTLAHLLGVKLPEVDGRVLREILK
jgi:predicted AlkP superfamily pyrophosphatase or phosphodiesterase